MFYAQTKATKKEPAAVVYIVAFNGDTAIALGQDGSFTAVALSDLRVPDANKATPFAAWPEPVPEPDEA